MPRTQKARPMAIPLGRGSDQDAERSPGIRGTLKGFLVRNMSNKYLYGGKAAEIKPAAGIAGVLIKDAKGGFAFRVYHEDGTFTDYDIRHDELSVTIDAAELASFYQIGDRFVLDHSPQVLGLEKVSE